MWKLAAQKNDREVRWVVPHKASKGRQIIAKQEEILSAGSPPELEFAKNMASPN